MGYRLNLAGLEAFDGLAFRVAGWSSIVILLIGLLMSCFIPMAYCHYGCPTGSLLSYLKLRADSYRLGLRDAIACGLLLVSWALVLGPLIDARKIRSQAAASS